MGEHPTRLERLLESIADGESVDWQTLEQEAGTDEALRQRIRDLRLIWGVAAAHRSLDGDESDLSTTLGTSAGGARRPDEVPEPEGRLWRHLRLVRKIGEGAFGEVYLAHDPLLDHSVALKLLKPDVTNRSRLLHEARTLARIRHENIVQVHGADIEDSRLGFWMEFIDGRTLSDVVEREGLRSAGEAAVIGQDLCRALAAVHGKGIAHRDIKAKNVMRENGGRIVLMDFGAGQPLLHELDHGQLTGTPLYLAPEVLGGGPASAQSDIYALAVLLFHLVTGGYPVIGTSLDDLKRAHADGRRHRLGDLRPDLPAAFVRVVETMLSPDPVDRYPTAATALAALETVVAPVAGPVNDRSRGLVSLLSTQDGNRLVRFAVGMGVVFAASLFSGYLTSVFYQNALELPDVFEFGSVVTWPLWGFRALLAGALVMVGVFMVWVVTRTVCKGVLATVPPLRRACQSGAARLAPLAEHVRAMPDSAVASWLMLLQLAIVALYAWRFRMIFEAMDSFLFQGSRTALAALAPGNRYDQILFDVYLNVQVMVFGVAWFRLLRRRAPDARMLVATGITVTALTFLVGKVVPYRALYHNQAERVSYNDTRCYLVAKRGNEGRVFCPKDTPRTIPVRLDDPALREEGVTENIFSVFDATP
jgi:serine/threonine-protein kinase